MKDGINAGDDKKEMAYQMGMQAGMNVKSRLFPQIEQQIFGKDSTKHLSGAMFLAGMLDGKNGVSALFDKGGVAYNTQSVGQFLQSRMEAMTAKANEKLYGPMKKKNEDFIKQMAKQPGVKALPGGVYYKELTPVPVPHPRATKSLRSPTKVNSLAARPSIRRTARPLSSPWAVSSPASRLHSPT